MPACAHGCVTIRYDMWALKSLYEKLTSEYKGVVNIAIGNC